jgi:hypothetical protein
MALPYGYRKGIQQLVMLPLDSTSADITATATAITSSGATANYFKEVDAAAEIVVGFSASKVDSPSADGGAYVKVDISTDSVYEFPPDAGTVSYGLIGKTCDIGADGQSVDIDGSSDDSLRIVDVDTTANTCFVQLRDNGTGVA